MDAFDKKKSIESSVVYIAYSTYIYHLWFMYQFDDAMAHVTLRFLRTTKYIYILRTKCNTSQYFTSWYGN